MEKLEAEVKRLRRQVNFLTTIIGIAVAVLLLHALFPSLRGFDIHKLVTYTDRVVTQTVELVDEHGVVQGRLTGDHLTYYSAPGEEGHSISTAVSLGVDRERQPDLSLSWHVGGERPEDASTGSMLIQRDHEGMPRASFFDMDGRDIPWNADR